MIDGLAAFGMLGETAGYAHTDRSEVKKSPLLPHPRFLLYRMETGKVTLDQRTGGAVAIRFDVYGR